MVPMMELVEIFLRQRFNAFKSLRVTRFHRIKFAVCQWMVAGALTLSSTIANLLCTIVNIRLRVRLISVDSVSHELFIGKINFHSFLQILGWCVLSRRRRHGDYFSNRKRGSSDSVGDNIFEFQFRTIVSKGLLPQ